MSTDGRTDMGPEDYPALRLKGTLAELLGRSDVFRTREEAAVSLILPPSFTRRLLSPEIVADNAVIDRYIQDKVNQGLAEIYGIPIVESSALVAEGEIGVLADLTLDLKYTAVLVDTHFNDAPDPDGRRLLCVHVGGSERRWADERATRDPDAVTCFNCFLTLKLKRERAAAEVSRPEESDD